MNYEQKNNTIKTIRFDDDLVEIIQKLANENERTFSKQVIYMIRKYLEVIK